MKYRLGDICRIEKGKTGITKAVSGPYPLVTTAVERKQHNEFQFDEKAVIIPLVSSSGHGHASLNRVHYQEGKFALGSILCAIIPKDENQVNAKYLYVYLQRFKDVVLVPLMRGAANVSLSIGKLATIEIEVPSLEKQVEIVHQEETLSKELADIEKLLIQQENDVFKLRQTLLREAVQGNLVVQDFQDEPASDLLNRIRAEKDELVKLGKLNKSKLLAPIRDDEKPFDIPENWVWCRLGDLCKSFINGIYKPESFYSEEGVISIRMFNIQNGELDLSKVRRLNVDKKELENYKVEEGDIILNRVNSYELVGKAAVVREASKMVFESMNMRIKTFYSTPLSFYLNKYFLTKYARHHFEQSLKKAANQVSINQTNVANLLIPLPPIAEQYRILYKLDKLLHYCDELEASIRRSRKQAIQLFQTALKEALADPMLVTQEH